MNKIFGITRAGWARFFCRIILGIIFLMAGWWKCFALTPAGHAEKYFTSPYADTWIPQWLLLVLGMAIPIVELTVGFLLVVGWRQGEALVAVGFILAVVTYGHLLQEALYPITGHILPRGALMAGALLLPAGEDILAVDAIFAWRTKRREAKARLSR